jgi:hypothetical protein
MILKKRLPGEGRQMWSERSGREKSVKSRYCLVIEIMKMRFFFYKLCVELGSGIVNQPLGKWWIFFD